MIIMYKIKKQFPHLALNSQNGILPVNVAQNGSLVILLKGYEVVAGG